MADCQIAVLRGDISDIILKKKDSYKTNLYHPINILNK